MSQPKLFSIVDRAIYDYALIEQGDNILVGASGGKDSTVLIHYLAQRKKYYKQDFSFTAVHVETEIASPFSKNLQSLFDIWQVPLEIISISVLERLKTGHSMNCWWCSTQRRSELNKFALEKGFNKIALGHHLDDILETLLMNMLNKGELSTMPPRLTYDAYPLTIIRPLCMVDEKTIIRHAQKYEFISSTCTCTYQDNSGRKEARQRLAQVTCGNVKEKQRLFMSLRNVKMDYLAYPPTKQDTTKV